MKKLTEEQLRKRILELVEEMGRTSRFDDYCRAREDFYLLPKIKSINPRRFVCARDVWEYAGLTRDDLVRVFSDVREKHNSQS